MNILLVKLRLPLFSIKHYETYQVAATLPFIPPSTVVGALVQAAARGGLCEGDCLAEVRGWIYKARDVAAPTVKFPVVLKRARGVLEEGKLPLSGEELGGYFDAMVREYAYVAEKAVLVVPSAEAHIGRLEKALWLLERVGDTESYVSVRGVEVLNARPCGAGEVDVAVKLAKVAGGAHLVVRAGDEDGTLSDFAVPLATGGKGYYTPTKIAVKSDVFCAGDVAFPAGHDW
ncbi:hypothetical protein PAE0209 [Pyrobaculum aerophilum str. IM2]|uniref:Type I-A CRISPR-associated protein Cas5 n=2 Tax=Pyrobaculum aerophilum TaxID=13773 RepID=Q8ZZL1_PYRAE|nr:type I-A CRISPR-associated protein Cas5a [Pyrobaculum aerophilum]AAL62628.1 hypothetical protein PAE0209 [Pyrobaculum aerophilum str. IM2]HII46683.1 type I-A CRISPR-associated protein Cas5 [Pyrobaculum aerophilum]